jgi:hypothetical protein
MHQHMCGGFCTVLALTRITPKEYKTFYGEITPAVCSFVNCCNQHSYKFRLTFCPRTKLTLHVMALTTRGVATVGRSKIHKEWHKVIFNRGFL